MTELYPFENFTNLASPYYDNVVKIMDEKGDIKFYRNFFGDLTIDSPELKEVLKNEDDKAT